jgi:hypothetical protein
MDKQSFIIGKSTISCGVKILFPSDYDDPESFVGLANKIYHDLDGMTIQAFSISLAALLQGDGSTSREIAYFHQSHTTMGHAAYTTANLARLFILAGPQTALADNPTIIISSITNQASIDRGLQNMRTLIVRDLGFTLLSKQLSVVPKIFWTSPSKRERLRPCLPMLEIDVFVCQHLDSVMASTLRGAASSCSGSYASDSTASTSISAPGSHPGHRKVRTIQWVSLVVLYFSLFCTSFFFPPPPVFFSLLFRLTKPCGKTTRSSFENCIILQ